MNTYELKNIAAQKRNSLKQESRIESLALGTVGKRSNIPARSIGVAVAILTVIGWVAQYL